MTDILKSKTELHMKKDSVTGREDDIKNSLCPLGARFNRKTDIILKEIMASSEAC